MIGRVTMTVYYRDMSKKASEFHCDTVHQATNLLKNIRGWSNFVLIGTNSGAWGDAMTGERDAQSKPDTTP